MRRTIDVSAPPMIVAVAVIGLHRPPGEYSRTAFSPGDRGPRSNWLRSVWLTDSSTDPSRSIAEARNDPDSFNPSRSSVMRSHPDRGDEGATASTGLSDVDVSGGFPAEEGGSAALNSTSPSGRAGAGSECHPTMAMNTTVIRTGRISAIFRPDIGYFFSMPRTRSQSVRRSGQLLRTGSLSPRP